MSTSTNAEPKCIRRVRKNLKFLQKWGRWAGLYLIVMGISFWVAAYLFGHSYPNGHQYRTSLVTLGFSNRSNSRTSRSSSRTTPFWKGLQLGCCWGPRGTDALPRRLFCSARNHGTAR